MSFQNRKKVINVSTSKTLTLNELEYSTLIVKTNSAVTTLTIPNMTSQDGTEMEFKRVGSNNAVIKFASDKLNGGAINQSVTLSSDGETARFVWNKEDASWYTM